MNQRQRAKKKFQAKEQIELHRQRNKDFPDDAEIREIQHKADKKIREKKRYKIRKNRKKREEARKDRVSKKVLEPTTSKLASWLLIPEKQDDDSLGEKDE